MRALKNYVWDNSPSSKLALDGYHRGDHRELRDLFHPGRSLPRAGGRGLRHDQRAQADVAGAAECAEGSDAVEPVQFRGLAQERHVPRQRSEAARADARPGQTVRHPDQRRRGGAADRGDFQESRDAGFQQRRLQEFRGEHPADRALERSGFVPVPAARTGAASVEPAGGPERTTGHHACGRSVVQAGERGVRDRGGVLQLLELPGERHDQDQ